MGLDGGREVRANIKSGPAAGGYFYLASPYSAPDPREVERRVELTLEALAELRRRELVVYSPIAHWHETTVTLGLPADAASWASQNLVMQNEARRGLIVLELPGWRESVGVGLEIDLALRLRQPIRKLVPTKELSTGRPGWLLIECSGDPRK